VARLDATGINELHARVCRALADPVPLENRIPALTWAFSGFRRLARIR